MIIKTIIQNNITSSSVLMSCVALIHSLSHTITKIVYTKKWFIMIHFEIPQESCFLSYF